MKLETAYNALKAYDIDDSLEFNIVCKLLKLKNINSYEDLGLKYNKKSRPATKAGLIGAIETLQILDQVEWRIYRQRVMKSYVNLVVGGKHMNITLAEAYTALKPLDRDGFIELSIIESKNNEGFSINDLNNCNSSIKKFEQNKLENCSISEYVEYRNEVMKAFVDKVGEIYKDEAKVVIMSLLQQQELRYERERSLF